MMARFRCVRMIWGVVKGNWYKMKMGLCRREQLAL